MVTGCMVKAPFSETRSYNRIKYNIINDVNIYSSFILTEGYFINNLSIIYYKD